MDLDGPCLSDILPRPDSPPSLGMPTGSHVPLLRASGGPRSAHCFQQGPPMVGHITSQKAEASLPSLQPAQRMLRSPPAKELNSLG